MKLNWLYPLLKSIGSFFSSSKGKQTIDTINQITEIALPIVQDIALMTGNVGAAASVGAVELAYEKYGVPLAYNLVSGDKQSVGNALLNLATAVVSKKLPPGKQGVATSLIQTGVQLAVIATQAK